MKINELLEDDKYLAIVNSSGWPPTRLLTMANKAEYLYGLIHQELVYRRESAITSFGKGLEHLGICTLIQKNYFVMKPAFVHVSKKLSGEDFANLISSNCRPPLGRQRLQTYQWFLQYVRDRDTAGMCMHVVCFLLIIQ